MKKDEAPLAERPTTAQIFGELLGFAVASSRSDQQGL